MAMELIRARVEAGVTEARKVLDATRHPVLASDAQHEYSDKFLLAEFMTQTATGSAFSALELLGLTGEKAAQLAEIAAGGRTVTLCFTRSETCKFLKKVEREVEDPVKRVTEVSGVSRTKITEKVVRKVEEWFWAFSATYELFAYGGNDPVGAKVPLTVATRTTTVKTTTDRSPRCETQSYADTECDFTWLARRVNAARGFEFAIGRSHKNCHTPLRNDDVAAALRAFEGLGRFGELVRVYFTQTLFPVEQDHALDLSQVSKPQTNYVLPVFLSDEEKASTPPAIADAGAEPSSAAAAPQQQVLLSDGDAQALLLDTRRRLDETCATLQTTFPADKGVITFAEAKACVVMRYLGGVHDAYEQGVNYIETMLREQLVAAIGKVVTAADFREYMAFHNRKLFKEDYVPSGFCYAIRRPGHNPEGVVSIEEAQGSGDAWKPATMVTRVYDESAERKFRFALSASAELSFTGKTYVHSYVAHRFSTERQAQVELVARAKQFSGFVVLLGQIGGKDLFLPKHAFLCQNKDEFKIPLALEEIPTPKEFKDAIASLSPEQQRFAKAYRAMQLEATLFGVCVIQVKPQLEKVLNLPPDALTKEIKLTQQLLELFIEYQIPSDVLSYQGDAYEDDADVSGEAKLEMVKRNVAAMREMLDESKKEEVEAAQQVREYEKARDAPVEEAFSFGGAPEKERKSESRSKGGGRRGMPMGLASLGAPPPPPPMCAPPQSAMPMQMAFGAAPPPMCAQPPPPPSGPPGGRPAPPPPPQPQESQPEQPVERPEAGAEAAPGVFDVSAIPQALEERYETLDVDSSLRPTIVKIGSSWTKTFQKKLLSKPATQQVSGKDELKKEKDKAFDLLDALTRSGVLAVEDANLHVVIAATHCFDKTLMDTVVQNNVNPIEKVERSTLIVASTIHGAPAAALVKEGHVGRIEELNPQLKALQ